MVSRYCNVLLGCLLLAYPLSLAAVFLKHEEASNVLQRKKRANTFFEEFKTGSLERECLEELCSLEEVREIFKDEKRAKEFWMQYTDANQCDSNPCQNDGQCVDQFQNYICICPVDYEGRNCESEHFPLIPVDTGKLLLCVNDQAYNGTAGLAYSYNKEHAAHPDTGVFDRWSRLATHHQLRTPEDRLKCFNENGDCEHYCTDTPTTVRQCFCADEYRLASDEVSCIPEVEYPCGKIPILEKKETQQGRIVGGYDCPPGECPWQALMLENDQVKCGGVLLAPSWIVTAAHCLEKTHRKVLKIKLGEYSRDQKDEGEQEKRVAQIIAHEKYIPGKADNDIALLRLETPVNFTDYVVPICLPEQQFATDVLAYTEYSTVSGWGRLIEGGATSAVLMQVRLRKVHTQECVQHTNMVITENMFCAGYRNGTKDSCKGDSGGPHATQYKNTWFLTGIVSWGKGCATQGTYGVYTNVAKYIDWLNKHMDS